MTGPSTSPYTPPTEGSYNASPPPDDGSQTEANRIKWSTIKTKLADIIRTFALAVDTATTTMAAKTINTDDGVANEIGGNIGFESDELTIATGAIVPNRSHHTVDTESDAASDDLATITNTSMAASAFLLLRAAHTDRTVVIKHGTGNIYLASDDDLSLDDTDKCVLLHRRGTDWFEVTRSGGVIDVQAFTSSGTWNKPGGGTYAHILQWGGGASGGKGGSGDARAGGGGGGFIEGHFALSVLGSTETVTIGAGGASQASPTTAGTAGGNTTFGSHLTAYGGGTNGTTGGGGGGGTTSAGSNGSTSTGGAGGALGGGAAGADSNFGGGGGGTAGGTVAGGDSGYGGGGGGATTATGTTGAGGTSIWGGGGGGGGTNGTSANPGGTSIFGGDGGAGNFDSGNAVAGGQPGGGGGGSETGDSGAGGDGMCIVIVT